MELFEYTATDLAAKLRKKECSAVEITESVAARIKAVDGQVNAYITTTENDALLVAKKVDQKIAAGEEIAPLAGIPCAVKDNICTDGVKTTAASKMLENFVPPYDATVIERMKNQLIPMIGKANMDEFAMGSTCETSFFQPTKNPRNLEMVPGGSSGGSAAAVAAGEAVLALGTDTGGSIREPAAYCGVVGLKPTYGAVSRFGAIAFASSLDQIGPLGRSVSDVALFYEAIRGQDPKDITSVGGQNEIISAKLDGTLPKGLRIGLPAEFFGDGVSPEVKAMVEKAALLFEKSGAQIKKITLPSTPYGLSAYYIVACAEAASNLARLDGVRYGHRAAEYADLTELYQNSRSEGFGEEVKRRIMLGTFVLSSGSIDAYYNKAKAVQSAIVKEFRQAFAEVDLILTPTTPDTAFPLGKTTADPVASYALDVCTVTTNLAGLPAISLPCGLCQNGLPAGLQMLAPWFGENQLLKAAFFYETQVGGFPGVARL